MHFEFLKLFKSLILLCVVGSSRKESKLKNGWECEASDEEGSDHSYLKDVFQCSSSDFVGRLSFTIQVSAFVTIILF